MSFPLAMSIAVPYFTIREGDSLALLAAFTPFLVVVPLYLTCVAVLLYMTGKIHPVNGVIPLSRFKVRAFIAERRTKRMSMS